MSLSRKVFCAAFSCSCLLAAALFVSPDAFARPENMGGMAASDRFAAMDTDKDAKLSREEFFAAQPNMKDAAFDAIDADKDGFISRAEWDAFSSGHGKDGGHADMMKGGEGKTMPPSGMAMPPASGGESKEAPALIMPPKKAE